MNFHVIEKENQIREKHPPVRGLPRVPQVFGCVVDQMVDEGARTPLVGVGAALREAHAIVEASRPQGLERQVVGVDGPIDAGRVRRRALARLLGREQLALLLGREDALGALQDAAHPRAACCAGTVRPDTLRPEAGPAARALQATYRAGRLASSNLAAFSLL